MKLFFAPASPFVRKVMVVALEKGVADRIEKINAAVSPVKSDPRVSAQNPLGKVPSAVLGDGRAIYDSRVIAAEVDSWKEPRLNPVSGNGLIDAMTLEALADGLTDAGLLIRYETMLRPENLRWADWVNGQNAKMDAGFDALESRWIPALNGPVTIGVISVACALGWISFRLTERDWRKTHPKLAVWFEEFSKRPSMMATVPKA